MFLLSLSHVQYEQAYWIYFCLFTPFSRHPISFLKKAVGMLIVISDPYMQETDLTQFNQLSIQTILLLCFCLYVE
jgi:hypothetical protein